MMRMLVGKRGWTGKGTGNVVAAEVWLLICVVGMMLVFNAAANAQQWKVAHKGVEHAKLRREFGGKFVDINLLRVDLKQVRLDVHHAKDMVLGTETTSAIAKRHGGIAAINAGFFRLDRTAFAGDPVGTFMIDGELWSEGAQGRVGLMLHNDPLSTRVLISHLKTNPVLYTRRPNTLTVLPILNSERKSDQVLYLPTFGPTTRTVTAGTDIIFTGCKKSRDNKSRDCREFKVIGNAIDTQIPSDGMVLSMPVSDSDILSKLDAFRRNRTSGARVGLGAGIRGGGAPVPYSKDTDVVTGVPLLIRGGKIDITWEQEKASRAFVETRHPRTAVAKLSDGKFMMLTADGRTENSAGLDLYDLAKLMLELGATDAMNLDGGGSTAMFLNGAIVNKPSDKEGERKVSDAIVVTARNRPRQK